MNSKLVWMIGLCAGLAASLLTGCAAPRAFWPQKDMAASQTAPSADAPTVLIASRSSDFKNALVERLGATLTSRGIGLKIIGVEALETIDAHDYDAVVVINTCLAWGLDRDVQGFLDRQSRYDHILVVTTSGKGDWLPARTNQDVDAISSASTLSEAGGVAGNIAAKIYAILQKPSG